MIFIRSCILKFDFRAELTAAENSDQMQRTQEKNKCENNTAQRCKRGGGDWGSGCV